MIVLRVLSILLIVIFISCSSDRKFSIEEWERKDDLAISQRKAMEKDLINNYLNDKLSYKDVITLLGVPDTKDSIKSTISYATYIEYEWLGIDETKIRYLDLVFDKDSTLMNSQIREWNKK